MQVNFRTAAGRTWAVFGNHWPSRSGGQFESAGYRQIAGETLAYFHQRALEVHGAATPALAMGDFNDEPFDASLVTHALSTRQRAKVTATTTVPRFWNLMWPTMGGPDGTFYFDNQPNVLDQFLINKKMAASSAELRVEASSVQIVRFPEMVAKGRIRVLARSVGWARDVDETGYSDHFPIIVTITEAE